MTESTEPIRTPRLDRTNLVRIGAVAVGAAVLIVSAAVAMAASPSPSPSGSASLAAPHNPGMPGSGGFFNGGRPFGPEGRGGMPRGPITIAAINGSNLSLKTADGWTRTIAVTSATTLTKGGQSIALGDLKIGDQIAFGQTRQSDGTYTINRVDVVVPHVGGSVTGLTATGFTLKSRDGSSWTITVTGSTKYALGPNSGAKSDVKVGSTVNVAGTQGSGNTLTALSVQIKLPSVAGTVKSVSGSTISVTRRDGTVATIHVGSGTTYRVPGVTTPTLANITVGMQILVQGTLNSDGSFNAVAVGSGKGHEGPEGPGN